MQSASVIEPEYMLRCRAEQQRALLRDGGTSLDEVSRSPFYSSHLWANALNFKNDS
jgi:hypothetical protein